MDEMRTNPRDSFVQHTASSGLISLRRHTRYLGVNLQQMQARQPVHQLLRDSALNERSRWTMQDGGLQTHLNVFGGRHSEFL